jgi:uncharacterized protein (TIGR02145 family)
MCKSSPISLLVIVFLFSILSDSCCKNAVDVPVVTTANITIITQTTASGGGTISSDGGAEITSKGICLSTNHNPSEVDSKTADGAGTASFKSSLTGLSSNTTYYVRAYATNCAGTGYGDELSFTTLKDIDFKSANDAEGNTYKTVQIGTQLWFAENLKTTKYNDGTAIMNVTDYNQWNNLTSPAYCWYQNNISFKDTFGALYNWYSVNTGKLCPVGWHIPTDIEWHSLILYLDPSATFNSNESYTAGAKMKVTGNEYWIFYPSDATNESGFSALGAGLRNLESVSVGYDYFAGFLGAWWSATEIDVSYAWGRGMNSQYSRVDRSAYLKWFGLSVRCIKD